MPHKTKVLAAWTACLGESNVIEHSGYLDMAEYAKREVLGELYPQNLEQLTETMKIALAHKVSVYPFSTGKNWGQGSRTPAYGGGVLLNLSKMDKIRYLDKALGVAIVEPGVTQAILSKALEGTEWMLNLTGSCSHTSMIGNILDRGVGVLHPRSQDVAGLEVVLASGEVVHMGSNWDLQDNKKSLNEDLHNIYTRYGLGPDMVQMFSQSNLGIVSAAVVHLTPRPEANLMLEVWFRKVDLSKAFDTAKDLYHRGLAEHALKCFNASSMKNYGLENSDNIDYCMLLPIHTTKRLQPHITDEILDFIKNAKIFENVRMWDLNTEWNEPSLYNRLSGFIDALIGSPSCAVHRSFAKGDCDLDKNSEIGWVLLCMVAPFVGDKVQEALDVAKKASEPFGKGEDITLNFFDKRTIELVCKTRFKRDSFEEAQKAHAYMSHLRESLIASGFYACRANVDDSMKPTKLYGEKQYFDILKGLKESLDPNNLIAPGRFINMEAGFARSLKLNE